MCVSEAVLPVIEAGQFFAVDVRQGVVVDVQDFPEARKPAFKIWVDFGEGIGIRKTSAQVTVHYTAESLMGRRVWGWVNAQPRQVGPFMSEFLLLGAADESGAIRLLSVDGEVPLGARMC